MKQITLLISGLIFSLFSATAQSVSLDSIFHEIDKSNPVVKMHDADIRSLNEAAKGARSWEAPELGTGFWMTPYNPALWKKNADGTTGMGQYMITVTQMIPNKKQLDANAKYMVAMSSVNEKNKQAALNELYAAAKKSYFAGNVGIGNSSPSSTLVVSQTTATEHISRHQGRPFVAVHNSQAQ